MKILKMLGITTVAVALSACTVGTINSVTKDGKLATDNIIWPAIEDADLSYNGTPGSWPNMVSARSVEPGMTKEQIYQLVDVPHYNEGFGAIGGIREWNYTFNFRENGEHKICQMKVLFTNKPFSKDNMTAGSVFWNPAKCAKPEYIEIPSDFLFDFDKSNLTARAHEVLAPMAEKFLKGKVRYIKIDGYTDRLGSFDYNIKLALRRAERVKQYFRSKGLDEGVRYEVDTHAWMSHVKDCKGQGQALRDCLRPNRRVKIHAE